MSLKPGFNQPDKITCLLYKIPVEFRLRTVGWTLQTLSALTCMYFIVLISLKLE